MAKKRYADCLDGHVWLVENSLFKCRYCGIFGDTCPECWALLPDEADDPECERCKGSGVVALDKHLTQPLETPPVSTERL